MIIVYPIVIIYVHHTFSTKIKVLLFQFIKMKIICIIKIWKGNVSILLKYIQISPQSSQNWVEQKSLFSVWDIFKRCLIFCDFSILYVCGGFCHCVCLFSFVLLIFLSVQSWYANQKLKEKLKNAINRLIHYFPYSC